MEKSSGELSVQRLLCACLLPCLLLLSSCSAANVYEIGRQQGLQDCERQPLALQASCREQYQMSYAEYQRLLADQEGRTENR